MTLPVHEAMRLLAIAFRACFPMRAGLAPTLRPAQVVSCPCRRDHLDSCHRNIAGRETDNDYPMRSIPSWMAMSISLWILSIICSKVNSPLSVRSQ